MAATVKGLAIVWAVNGITFTAGIVSATTGAETQSLNLVRSSNRVDIMNDIGETVGEVYVNGKKEITVKAVPSHASAISSAQTSADAWTPAPGTKMTIADAEGTIIDGDYNLDEATLDADNQSPRTVTIKMHKFDANDVTATIT